jgi:ribosomal subunit interface protein
MNITIKGTRHELTDETRALIEDKLSAIDRLVGGGVAATLSCEIEQSIAVERAGAKYRAEGNLSVDGKLYRAESEGVTLEEAIDKVRDELAREYKRAQGKKRELVRRGGAALKRMLRFGRSAD